LLQQKNDYELRIFNGDTGMLWYADENRDPLPRHAATASTRLLVFFRQEDKSWRGVERELLSDADTAFAMTVHKSQGSGYDRILLFLPDQKENPVLSRELIYTAITRAKKEAVVISNRESFITAADTKTVRNSGLIDSGL
jgi:exodeoxyribonuclease V alpha subunit